MPVKGVAYERGIDDSGCYGCCFCRDWVRNLLQPGYQHVPFLLCGIPCRRGKKGILSFVSFFFGKMVSVTCLCMVSALVSRQFISESGYIGSFNLRLFSQTVMSMIGVAMIVRWFMESGREKKCGGCRECGKKEEKRVLLQCLLQAFHTV